MLTLDYFYDVPLPNTFSATTQCLKTGRALAEAGLRFTFRTGPMQGSAEAQLAALGLTSHENLRLRPHFPSWPRSPALRRRILHARMALAPPAADAVMSRGESGFLFASPRRAGGTPPFIYEMHRLSYLAEAEARLGRRLASQDAMPASARRLRRWEAATVARADGFVFLTEALRDAAAEAFGLNGRPFVIAPSGVDMPPADQAASPDVDIVVLGKVERRKGIDLALQALAQLPDRTMRIIGDGPFLDEARRMAQHLGVEPRVEFAGRIPHVAVPQALRRGRIGLCPLPLGVDQVSDRFTSPMKLLEMMAAALPVVATDVPSVRAIVTDPAQARLTPAGDPAALARAIGDLLQDPAQQRRLAAAGRTRAADFGWTRRAGLIKDLVERVVTGKS